MRSTTELLDASGYRNRPKDFQDLLLILDSEIRLITPIDPVSNEDTSTRQEQAGERYYQLTHDYLVPSLRDWLTRKQRETKEGRAELLLEDCVNLWLQRQDDRLLPTQDQWIDIFSFTQRDKWNDHQRRMMELATSYHVIQVRDRILNAVTTEVPAILEEMRPYRHLIADPLRHAFGAKRTKGDAQKQLHASLALLPLDPGQATYLLERLLEAELHQIPIIRDALALAKSAVEEKLWTVLMQPGREHEPQRLRAASALAGYAPGSEKWPEVRDRIANDLVEVPESRLAAWMDLLRPLREQLLIGVATVFRDRHRSETQHCLAALILAEYAANERGTLTDFLLDAETEQFLILYARLRLLGDDELTLLQAEIDKPSPLDQDAKEKLAKRQANAAVALLHMNRPEKVWTLLALSPDPRVRSYLIHLLGPLGVDAGAIVGHLERETDQSICRALLLSLGEYGDKEFQPDDRKALMPKLQHMYQTATDPGLHAAAEWLLRRFNQGEWVRGVNMEWAQKKEERQKRLEDIRRLLCKAQATSQPQWYVNCQGQTMVVIPGPMASVMGSPTTERDRADDEIRHRRRIGRSFAIAAKSVSVEQYLRFDECYEFLQEHNRTRELPVVGINWYTAARYCNWLSKAEEIPEDQWCYEFKEETTHLKDRHLSMAGYRLPTEAEMEYATRAGALTSRCYGETDELLSMYAWYSKNSQEKAWAVGSLKPNDLGLFDVHGNVFTWCEGMYRTYSKESEAEVSDEEEEETMVKSVNSRVLRGGSFLMSASGVRSAYRYYNVPTTEYSVIGFRPARTIVP
jgi:formylglycine-generating enzyme required for sulfatase activity